MLLPYLLLLLPIFKVQAGCTDRGSTQDPRPRAWDCFDIAAEIRELPEQDRPRNFASRTVLAPAPVVRVPASFSKNTCLLSILVDNPPGRDTGSLADVVTAVRSVVAECIVSGASLHIGGEMAFGVDGFAKVIIEAAPRVRGNRTIELCGVGSLRTESAKD